MNVERILEDRREKAEKESLKQDERKSSIPFLKVGQGKHILRFLPKGNKQEGLPYKSIITHTFKLKNESSGSPIYVYATCYNWLFAHKNAKEATIQPLIDMGVLSKADISAFKKNQCPVCRARRTLFDGGEAKETYQSCNVKGTNYWNVLLRSDSKIYVYSASDQRHQEVTGMIEMYLDIDETTGHIGESAVDILDPKAGYDFILGATGEKNNRRYSLNIKPKSCPIGEIADGDRPIDLMTVVAETTKSYAELCMLLKRMQGKLLASYGFDYGIVMPDDRGPAKEDNTWDDEDDEPKKSSNHLKVKAKLEDEVDPVKQIIVKSQVKDFDDGRDATKTKINPLTGVKQTKAPWDDDDEDEEEEEVPIKKLSAYGATKNTKVAQKTVLDDEDENSDDDDTEFDEGYLINKRTGKRIL
jgi:hypothetical protein